MYPKPFKYYRASSISEAIEMLEEDEGAKLIGGGQSLVPMMKLGILAPSALVDIGRLKELKYIRASSDSVIIGALVTHSEVEESGDIIEKVPLLAQAASLIGDTQIRDMGTIGGSVAHADPSADYLPNLLVLNARVYISGRSGKREMPIAEFIQGPFMTGLDHNEIVESIKVPTYKGVAHYEKFSIRRQDFGLVNVSMLADFKISETGSIGVNDFRVAIGGLESGPRRLGDIEKAVLDREKFDTFQSLKDMIRSMIEKEELSFQDTLHGSAKYRRHLANVMVVRTLEQVYIKARGGVA